MSLSEPFIRLRAPPSYYFQFPPSPEPEALPPVEADHTLARPFNIKPELHNQLLDVRIPLTIAAVYATTVFSLNRLNKSRGNKPWAISQTGTFFALMILHNVFLAVYSGWTFVGMVNALANTWPGWKDSKSLLEVVDAYCKMSGPRGLGDAAWWNKANGNWTINNPAIKLLGTKPDGTDVGRLWNEGLAFYGWLFYLSKFYEVVDTMIILAKGKRSSFLQTYHHAGAMLCMWAGIRYMSPPIWMFVCVNSGIHAMMYTYYTLSALGIRVPSIIKKTLTTLQITQFVVGFTYAVFHLFVAYRVPIHTPYVFLHNLSTALPSATSTVAAAASTADIGSWVKRAVLRAVGDEGLSENVRNNNGNLFGLEGSKAVQAELASVQKAREEIRYRLEYAEANCIDTSGQAFAILLNALYLLPLTMLFVRFFIRSYLRRASGPSKTAYSKQLQKSSYDAVRGVNREVLKAMSRDRGSAYNSTSTSDAENGSPVEQDFKEKASEYKEMLNQQINSASQKFSEKTTHATQITEQRVQQVKEEVSQSVEKLENFDDLSEETKEVIARVTQNTKDSTVKLAKLTEEKADKVVRELKEATSSNVAEKSEPGGEDAKQEPQSEPVGTGVKDEPKNSVDEGSKDQSSTQATSGAHADEAKKEDTAGAESGSRSAQTAEAYEASVDEVTTQEQKASEEKMQPDVVKEAKSES